MKIAIVSGLCVRHDAISNSVLNQRRVLLDAGHDVKVFTHHTDVLDEPAVKLVHDPWTLAREPFYDTADLVIFHFGIRYGLFNALLLDHDHAVRIVHFHNVTPLELLDGPARQAAAEALDQIAIVDRADLVWSDSPHNTEVILAETDVDPDKVHAVPLCVPAMLRGDNPRPHSGVIRVVSVGRFVRAKGLHVLVEAFARLPEQLVRESEVVLVGSLSHSDRSYIAGLETMIAESGLAGRVQMLHDIADDELQRMYCRADVFVSASFHEGFCVPVIEALSAGCEVVVSDAGALPDTVGPCGWVVPVGDSGALADALEAAMRASRAPKDPAVEVRRAEHVHRFGRESHRAVLLQEVERAASLRPTPPNAGSPQIVQAVSSIVDAATGAATAAPSGLSLQEFRARFERGEFSMENPEAASLDPEQLVDRSLDPLSEEYAARVMQAWSAVSGRVAYVAESSESFDLDLDLHMGQPWPYISGDPVEVAHYFGAVARTLELLERPPPARIIEYGSGWGHMALMLAATGYDVTAVDLNASSVELLRRRAEALDIPLHVHRASFLEYRPEGQVDAIVFYEAFHHCDRPFELLDLCAKWLVPGGQLIFVADAFYPGFYAPWGVRQSGDAAIMTASEGWLELGFDLEFFIHELRVRGFATEFITDDRLGAHGTFLIGRRG